MTKFIRSVAVLSTLVLATACSRQVDVKIGLVGPMTGALAHNGKSMAQGAQIAASLALASLKPSKASKPEMVMAAVAAAWALDIPVELIGAGLRTFESAPKKTPY